MPVLFSRRRMTHRRLAALAGTAALGTSLLLCPLAARADAAAAAAASPNGFAHDLYPLAKPLPTPRIVVDISDAPDASVFAANSQKLVEQWFPLLCEFLGTKDYTPPATIILRFRKDLSAPAYTTGTGSNSATISINDKWISAHPDDYGMVIHELTHVVQSYPGQGDKPGWLVEGIADYIRFYRYEPDVPRPRVDPVKSRYTDAYRTTAAFLAYVTGKYDRGLVSKLDEALRAGTYSSALWTTITGKDVDTLWAEFVQTLPRPRPAA